MIPSEAIRLTTTLEEVGEVLKKINDSLETLNETIRNGQPREWQGGPL